MSPHRTRSAPRWALCAAAAAVFAAGCAESTDSAGSGGATAAADGERSCSADMRSLARDWNRDTALILGDFLDDTVSVDAYLATSQRLLPRAEATVRAMGSLRPDCTPQEWDAISRLLPTYEDKLTGYALLETAVQLGSPAAADDAFAILEQANAESTAIACEIAAITGEVLPPSAPC